VITVIKRILFPENDLPARTPGFPGRPRSALGSIAALLALGSLACHAPPSEAIQGKVFDAVQRGIESGRESFSHDAWDEILQLYDKDGGRSFDYAGLKKEEALLEAYLETLTRAPLSRLSRNELLALSINAYNAYTVRTILGKLSRDGAYSIESIRDISEVFGRKKHVVGGFTLSLDNIEHNLLRPLFNDPRIHFAVNCASISCPPLPPKAFRGETVDEQLEEATRLALQSPDYARVEGDRLLLTKILDWYGEDFVNPDFRGAEATLPAFVRKYATGSVGEWIDAQAKPRVKFMDYDWRLNRWR
jgi:hypothetical protein